MRRDKWESEMDKVTEGKPVIVTINGRNYRGTLTYLGYDRIVMEGSTKSVTIPVSKIDNINPYGVGEPLAKQRTYSPTKNKYANKFSATLYGVYIPGLSSCGKVMHAATC